MGSGRATPLWPPVKFVLKNMPSFGEVFTENYTQRVLGNIRTGVRNFKIQLNWMSCATPIQSVFEIVMLVMSFVFTLIPFRRKVSLQRQKSDQAARPISIGPLNGLLRLHAQPINPVVCRGSLGILRSGKPYLGRSLALRCFQRLSLPHMATQRCPRWNNCHTRSASNPVLSY